MSFLPYSDHHFEASIKLAAYYRYENRRRAGQEGTALDDWFFAEAELKESTQEPGLAGAMLSGDLTVIKGIGKVLAERLRQAGHSSLEKIASWTASEIEELDAALQLRGRIARDGWVAQAKGFLGN